MPVDHLRRADDLIELKKYSLATREARRALAQNPENGEAHYLLAWALWKSAKTETAFRSAEKAVHCAPEDAYAHSLLARLFDETRNRKKGEAHHQKAIQLRPNTADFYVTYALHLYRYTPALASPFIPYTPVWQDWKKAMKLLEQALQLNPRHAGAYRVRAMWLGRGKRFSEAYQDAQMALEISPNHPNSHTVLGDLHIAEFHLSEAFSAYREALRLNPDNKEIKTKLIHTLEARIPWIGILWHLSRGRPAGWRGSLLATVSLLLPILFLYLDLQLLFVVYFPLLLLFFLLLNTVGNFLLTQAVLKGWIKI